MSHKKTVNTPDKGNSNYTAVIVVAVIGLIGTFITAYFSFLANVVPTELSIKATKTAEAELIKPISTATSDSIDTTLTPIPTQETTPLFPQSTSMIMSPAPHNFKLGKLLFQEDFNGNTNQWPTGTDSNGTYYIDDGEYHIIGPDDNVSGIKWLAQFMKPEQIYDDFYLETKVRFVQGSQQSDSYGVLFRSSHGSTYIFVIGNAQQVYSLHTEKTTLLWWTYSPKIIKDGTNKIGILCKGDEITIYINGDEVDRVKSDYRDSGGIGLDYASNEHIAFDYIYVWALSE